MKTPEQFLDLEFYGQYATTEEKLKYFQGRANALEEWLNRIP